MNDAPANLSPVVRLACALVRCNPDLLALSPRQDRYAVVSEALLLSVVAGVTGLAWTAFWAQFVALPAAFAFGALACVFMFLIDQAIGAADWRLTGVLRQPGARRRWWEHGRLAMRLAMTLILSTATSTGASMAMFHDAIRTQLEQDVRGKNRQIEEQYAERLREQRSLRFGTLEAEVQRLTASAGEMTRVLDGARQLRATASQRAEAYGIETDRELKGAPGYKAGAGSKYREALARKVAADGDLAKADSDISVYEARLTDAQKKLDKASADLRAAESAFASEAAQIDEERKSHLIPDRNDALMSYLALEEVYADPRFGTAARHFSWLMMAVLMTFELSYVVVRAWFTHASVYMAILIGDTKKRADRAAADYETCRAALRHAPGASALSGRAPLRFLPAPSPGAAAVREAREFGAEESSPLVRPHSNRTALSSTGGSIMLQKVRSPFAGKPATRQVYDRNGAPAFYVQPRVLTPVRAMAASWLTGLGVVAGLGYGLAGVASAPNPDSGMLTAAFVVPIVGGFALYGALRSLLRKRFRLMLTLEQFSVKTLFGWKHYDRLLPHRFALLQHDWTQREQEQQEFQAAQAQMKGKLVRRAHWYANSFHLSFDYLGQRNDVLTVYGPKEAMAIVTRLNACDNVLDALARRGQGTPLTPADEWGDQPGAIPELP